MQQAVQLAGSITHEQEILNLFERISYYDNPVGTRLLCHFGSGAAELMKKGDKDRL
ncbi:hypothetical protein PHLCEN_2v10235 [Hermanssonia centrifuga]|uniref:Uncharacterized protein n=1 Tax=Hermanssonia centrifuga TaxID=98765 RepID=A0A2R6NNH2_9APHY|nr:hypothetical protein PHLCEN_2v10235 [Hermanssonia centrifuga]